MARYALVIGISEYQSSNLSRLPKTVTDAEAVVQILKQYGDFQIVKRLPERWNQQQNDYEIGTKAVTGNELGQALRTFLLEQAYRSDALIYFSGHGITVSDNLGQTKGYLATSDCVLETDGKRIVGQQHGIALDSLNELIRAAELSSLVLLLDCCHGGYFLERQLVEQTLTTFSSQKDYYVITACRTFEQAWAMHDEKHDVFTGAVLNGLALENAAKDGSVSGDRLFDRISTQLKGKRQEPIRMGWGKSITIVNYPLTENTPSATFTFNRENPYQGLQAFELGKEKYFFGREQAIRALLERLNNARFLSVIGRSGCGKSSLVKAGLLPELQSDRLPGSSQWEIEIFTPGIDPLGKLTEILGRRHQENKPFVLFIDQFEEVFTLCNDEAKRQSFMRLMADEATASDRITRVIVAIRGDFLDRCAAYPEAVNLINRTQPTTYVVELLSHSEIVETIEKPAELHGVGFEPGLVSQIAEDVENQPGALPLLQYALSELWRKFCEQYSPSGQPLLAWKDYEEIGGVKGALDNRATILYRSFIPEDQAFVRRLFIKLVKLGDGNEVTRRRATWEELSAIADSPEQLQQVVRLLADQQQRLIITDENTIEVAHEALLSEWKLLCSWIEEDRDNIRLKQSLEDDCREWLERFTKSDDALLTGARLAAIEEWVNTTQPRLPPLEAEFLKKSVERRDREIQEKIEAAKREVEARAEAAEALSKAQIAEIEKSLAAKDKAEAEAREQAAKAREAEARAKFQKQRTRFAIAGGIFTAITLGLGLLTQRLEAQKKQGEAIAVGALIGKSEQFLEQHSQLEALIASVESLNKLKEIGIKNSTELKKIQRVIYRIQERNRLQVHQGGVYGVNFSPDGKMLVSGGVDEKIILWTPEGKMLFPPIKKHTEQIRNVRFSPDNKLFASTSIDKTVIIWNNQGKNINTLSGHQDNVYDISFTKDSRQIASSSKDGSIKIWDVKSGKLLKNLSYKQSVKEVYPIYELDFNPGNKSILVSTGFKDYDINIWYLGNLKNNPSLKHIGKNNSIVKSVRFNQSGTLIASGDSKGVIKIWNANGILVGGIKQELQEIILHLEFSKDSKLIASASLDGKIRIYSVDKVLKEWKNNQTKVNQPLEIIQGNTGSVNSISFNPENSNIIAAASDDGSVRIWDILKKHDDDVYSVDKLLIEGCKKLKNHHNYLETSNKILPKSYFICK